MFVWLICLIFPFVENKDREKQRYSNTYFSLFLENRIKSQIINYLSFYTFYVKYIEPASFTKKVKSPLANFILDIYICPFSRIPIDFSKKSKKCHFTIFLTLQKSYGKPICINIFILLR